MLENVDELAKDSGGICVRARHRFDAAPCDMVAAAASPAAAGLVCCTETN